MMEVLIVICIFLALIGLTLSAVQRVRESASRAACSYQLRQIGLALHQYHLTFEMFPTGVSHPYGFSHTNMSFGPDVDRYPLLNWHGRILPYIEYQSVWLLVEKAYSQDSRHLEDPPHVGRFISIPIFLCPNDEVHKLSDLPHGGPGMTSYLGISGIRSFRENGIFFIDSHIRLSDIKDGASNTLMVGERPPSADLSLGRWYGAWGNWGLANAFLGVQEDTGSGTWIRGCSSGPYEYSSGSLQDRCSAFHFWSTHIGGANFIMADGSVHFLPYSSVAIMPALATRAGGETVTPDF